MTRKIFRSIMLACSIVLLSGIITVLGCLYNQFELAGEEQMRDALSLAAAGIREQGEAYLADVDTDRFRLTWIDSDGTVLGDTKSDAETLENHADREEFKEALETGEGNSRRYSRTLLEETLYCARRLSDGTVLRISVSRATMARLALGTLEPVLLIVVAALLLSGGLANRLSRRIVAPLNSINLEQPLENEPYEEIAPLLSHLNQQHIQISAQLRDLQRKKDEFAQITGYMKEGLVLLDDHGVILSINPAARAIFSTDSGSVGRDFWEIDRSHDMSHAIHLAMEQGHGELRAPRGGRIFQFDISRIESGNAVIGAVLLAFDITERENAEQSRREFTANVSHELKTPLQGIIGSAELLENGLVRAEDLPRFAGHIHTEAQRLLSLIQDIIRLSQLDEGAQLPQEPVDLYEVAREAVRDLEQAARSRGVTLTASGESVTVQGTKRLLYEAVRNLCDNAVQYNREGGRAEVRVDTENDQARVTVRDNGIGIAPEHQSRIFERFYRVDKSRSRASGGTGLGLSIVKHAVLAHHGTIELSSVPDEGTTITLRIPMSENDAPQSDETIGKK